MFAYTTILNSVTLSGSDISDYNVLRKYSFIFYFTMRDFYFHTNSKGHDTIIISPIDIKITLQSQRAQLFLQPCPTVQRGMPVCTLLQFAF